MQCIVIGNVKGGCGKTTIAINLAVELALRGKKILIVDSDEQLKSTTGWAYQRQSTQVNITATPLYEPVFVQTIPVIGAGVDYVIVDAGGRDSAVVRSAIAASDLLIVPLSASAQDVWAIDQTLELIRECESAGCLINPHIVLNQVVANTIIDREIEDTELDIPKLKTKIYYRQAYKLSLLHGQGVSEMNPKSKAAAEINNLANEILELIPEQKKED